MTDDAPAIASARRPRNAPDNATSPDDEDAADEPEVVTDEPPN
jgi:hypothetical protein